MQSHKFTEFLRFLYAKMIYKAQLVETELEKRICLRADGERRPRLTQCPMNSCEGK